MYLPISFWLHTNCAPSKKQSVKRTLVHTFPGRCVACSSCRPGMKRTNAWPDDWGSGSFKAMRWTQEAVATADGQKQTDHNKDCEDGDKTWWEAKASWNGYKSWWDGYKSWQDDSKGYTSWQDDYKGYTSWQDDYKDYRYYWAWPGHEAKEKQNDQHDDWTYTEDLKQQDKWYEAGWKTQEAMWDANLAQQQVAQEAGHNYELWMTEKARWDGYVQDYDEEHAEGECPRPSAESQPEAYVPNMWVEKTVHEAFKGLEEAPQPKAAAEASGAGSPSETEVAPDDEEEAEAPRDVYEDVDVEQEGEYDPSKYVVTKTGYQNYACLVISLYRMGRFSMLERSINKLLQKQQFRLSVLKLCSHIQKFADTGPRRLGFDFD